MVHPDPNIIHKVSLDLILEPKNSARTVIALEGLEELSKSICAVGVLQPISVRKSGSKYEIVAGHRRYLASRMAGKADIPAVIISADEMNTDMIRLHENYCREDLNPVDEAKYFQGLKERYGWSVREIAVFISKSESYVVARMQFLGADERVVAALEGGQISISQAREILAAESEKVIGELLRVTIENGATVNSIRVMRQSYESLNAGHTPPGGSSSAAASSYEVEKHLIKCPSCAGAYPVNQIYPISLCKTCYDGLLAGLARRGA